MTDVQIKRELLERILPVLDKAAFYQFGDPVTPDSKVANDLRTELLAILAQPAQQGEAVEVVGWRRLDRKYELTAYPSVCAIWHGVGYPVQALYTHPAASVPAVADCDDSGSVTLTTEAAQIIAQCIGAHAYVMGALQNGRPDLALAESARWVEGFSHASLLASAEGVKDE